MKGWLLDLYPSDEEIAIWLKGANGEIFEFTDNFNPTLYVAGSRVDLEDLEPELVESKSAQKWSYVKRRVRLRDFKKSKVLKVECGSMKRFPHFARKLVRLGGYKKYHLYNVDIPYSQAYLFKRGLFPLAKLRFHVMPKLSFDLLDSVEDTDYELPPLKSAWLQVKAERGGLVATFEDAIASIMLRMNGEEFIIKDADEPEKLMNLVSLIEEKDPDLIFTRGGDSWDLPYIAERAKANDMKDELILGREKKPLRAMRGKGRSFFSYGRVYYKPPAYYLRGRIHVDIKNSFIYGECGLEGLIELSRVTRTPLQRMARSSIGSAMTNLQLYQALDNGVLIPWMKREAEEFKTSWKLLEADRGGFVYEPRVGIHEVVGELDFGSFYPAMMEKYNISPETVLCDCCPDSSQRVPELGYNICERRRGLIPQVVDLMLKKRREYKRRMNEAADSRIREINNRRQSAIKWILVTCFGYLGYKNARFGRIEAHESVTAFARENLLEASRIAERNGFEIVHGIVDSLWAKKSVDRSEFESLCEQIEGEIGLPIELEGIYRWIVFPTSKIRPQQPVPNRFFGVFEDGRLKARGIKMRRRDTPKLIRKFQGEILDLVGEAESADEFLERIPEALEILPRYIDILRDLKLGPTDLSVTEQLSRHPRAYNVNARSAIAAKQMLDAGIELRAGQHISYIVTNADANNPMLRVKPLPLIRGELSFDFSWYMNQLVDAVEELFRPFGYTRERIRSEKLAGNKQLKLSSLMKN